MCIKIVQENRDRSRFWELFRPTTNNLQFWLASAAFLFFISALLLPRLEAGMSISILDSWREVASWILFGFGCVGIAVAGYLFVTWITNKGLKNTKKSEPEQAQDLSQSLIDIETKVNELRSELSAIVKKAKRTLRKPDGE